MNDLFGSRYLESLKERGAKKKLPPTRDHALADEIIKYFNDPSVNFKSVFFGIIRNGIGYQGAFEALREMRTRSRRDAKYFWGIIRSNKKEIKWIEK